MNLYGHKEIYENLVNFNCDRINTITKNDFFNSSNFNTLIGDEINFEEDDDLDFVPTDEAKIRVAYILLAAKSHIFLLITGPTSSAKTFSVFVAYKLFYQKQIKEGKNIKERPLRMNLSEETSRDDLIGSIVYDEKKCQFIFRSGPFTEAYEKGYWLLIDELSLAPPSVLQAIEAALDSKHLTVQKIGKTEEIEMHQNFNLICTTNPNNEYYQRYVLPANFLDRFLCIEFDNLSNDEMKKILMKKCKGTANEDDVQKIIDSHYLHTNDTDLKCRNMYTLRELDKARFLFKQKFSTNQIIDILYHTRSGENLITYESIDEDPFSDVNDFISTENRKKYGKLALDCLSSGFNIILENEKSEGTSYLAEVIAKKFNKDSNPLIINMTDELHVSDITEFSVPRLSKVDIEIKRVNGIIYQAMKDGNVVIINDIERGKTRVIESLNDVYESNLLDEKLIKIDRGFKINPKFRIIFTFHSNVPHKLSAAFFNRFIHIKMFPTGEISNFFKIKKGHPINKFCKSFPTIPDLSADVQYLCKKKNIAPTSQIETYYALTKQSIENGIPICISSEIGYGTNLGMHLFLDEISDLSKIHTIYCTSETSAEQLIGKYIFEGELLFQKGELLQAAINGDIIIFHGIEKLTYHVYSCLEAILDCLIDETRELIIPGICVSEYKISKKFRCLATYNVSHTENKDIKHHISKYFQILPKKSKSSFDDKKDYIRRLPIPTREDYLKISKLNDDLYSSYSGVIDNLITCFTSCYSKRNIFDTTFRMFIRMIKSIPELIISKSPIEEAICLFAFFQNVNDNTLNDLLTCLNETLSFDYTKIEDLIKCNVKKQKNELVKGPLSILLDESEFASSINNMSTEQLNSTFGLVGIKSPKILVGPTSFKETLIKKYKYQERVRVFNATSDSTINEIIGGTSFKKNHSQSGRFGHGEIFDLLIEYMQTNPLMNAQINNHDLHSNEIFDVIWSLIDEMEDEYLKPYFKYLFDIIKKESQYATFYELGFFVRELLLGNTILLKNVDDLNESIIDSLIPFLNDSINLKQCLPGDFNYLNDIQIKNPSIFFTCSETKFNRLSASFRSRVQAIHIKNLTKDDLKQCVDDEILLEAYDVKIKDYSDIMRAINVIKIAGVLNKFDTPEERIEIANKILSKDKNIFNDGKIFELHELIKYNEKTDELISIRTGATIKVNGYNDKKIKELIYVPSLAFLLDLTIISLATHIPLIIESSPGQAKSTFIRDFGSAIIKKVDPNNMSKNKPIDEFIGQIKPNEDGFSYEIGSLYKKLIEDEIYLIDEFNLASPSILALFLNVFKAPYDTEVIHPHEKGPFIKKFDIIATMNPAILTADRMSLPTRFSSCSLIYEMEDYTNSDITIIIAKIFNKLQYAPIFKNYEDTIKFIGECHALGMNQSNDVTIRDILKLKEIFQSGQINDDEIPRSKKKMKDENKIKIASYVDLVYSSKMSNCMDQFDDIFRKYLGSENIESIPDNVIKEQYKLKKQMKVALEKTNRGLIITGPSGSGKTRCIIDMANGEFDNKKHTLHTVQLCAESDISELLGRYEPLYSEKNALLDIFIKELKSPFWNKELVSKDRTTLDEYLKDLSNPEKVEETIEKIQNNSSLMANSKLAKKIDHFRKNWKQTISFDYIESLLVKAMRKGDWVVLDNINLCPGDILESLNSLLEENHILHLPNNETYAIDPDPNNPEIFKINPNFRIIMTSDDQNKNESHIIPSPFLSRCIVLKIKKPGNQDLALIGKDIFNIPYYTDFMSKCFSDDSKSHVRDIIRMANVCKFLHKNAELEIEDEIGKTIKFVLPNNKNFNIPEKYKNSKKDGDNIYRFIISIFQTNLIDYTIDDESFKPFDLTELIKTIQNLRESDLLNKLFKETLRLACYVLSTKPCINYGENYTVQEKIISLLLCAYLLTSGSNDVQVPDFFWELKFTPAIWDLIFVARDEYDKLTNLYGFKQFMELHTESEELICESYNYFKKDMKELLSDKMEEYLDTQIKEMFNRTSIERKDDPLLNPNKNEIELEKIPISFPSIPNNRLILNTISYYTTIELLDFLNITPTINLLKIFNINLEEKSIFKEYKLFFLDTMDLDHAQTYNKLLTEYNLIFPLFKEIYNIPDNTENLLTSINTICKKYNKNTGDLSRINLEFKHFCEKEQNKCNITACILDVLLKVENMIQYAFEQKRMKSSIHDKQNENRIKALNILQKTQNIYIKEQIKSLMETFINENKINEIIKLGMIDKYITNNESQISESKFLNFKYICTYNYGLPNCREIELSVIITKFIIPAHCIEFQISDNIYQILNKRMSTTDIQALLSDIELRNLNKEQANYHFLEIMLNKMKFQPITMQNINSKEVISNIIKNMNQYSIFNCIALDSSRPKEYIVRMQKKEGFYGINEEFTSHLSEEMQEQIFIEQTKMMKDIRNLHLEIIPLSLLKEKCKSIPEEDYGNTVSLKCDERIEGNSIAKLAHFLTDQEIQKLQFEKQDIISIVINGQGYKIIPIESLIVNLIYISKYDIIENSLAKELNMIDQIIEILHPITPQDILKKDIILFLSEINIDDINENEKKVIIENIDKLLSSDNLDINNLSLNILYNESFRKKKIQYIIKANEINYAQEAIDQMSTIIKNTIKQIEENFKFIICERTRKEIEDEEGQKVFNDIYQLALQILKPIKDSKENGIKIVKNDEKFIQKASGLNKFVHRIDMFEMFNTVFSEESLKPDPSITPDIKSTILQCKVDYHNYQTYADRIKWIDLHQPQVSVFYINKILSCPNDQVKQLCKQILSSIEKIQGMKNQEFKDPYLPKIYINPKIDLPKNISDLLIIGYINNKITLLNEVNYDLGNLIPNSTLKINMFNITNAKIRTEPASEIQQIKDGVISSIKMTKDKEMMKMNIINDIDNSLIGKLNFRFCFNKPKMYLLFSKPVTIKANSISVKGKIYEKLTIFIFSDTSLMYNILKIDDIDSEFTENQIEIDDENYDKISFIFKKHGKFKARVYINFPLINLTLPLIIDINVKRKQRTYIYKFNNFDVLEECKQKVEMSVPSFVAIISPQLLQNSEDVDIENKINNNEYLHLAYIKHNSKIETINGSIDFIFRETYFPIKYQDKFVPQLSKFNFNYPRGVFGYFKYFDNTVTFHQNRNTETIVQLNYEHDKLKNITFRSTIYHGKEKANYNQIGIFYDHEDRYNNKLDMLIEQIEEKQKEVHFDLSTNFTIPWIYIILLFDRTKEELHDLLVNEITNNFILKDKKTYFVIADDESLNPIKSIPKEILSSRKIKSTSRRITDITTEMFDHLGFINYDNLFEILANLDSIRLGLLHYRQICDYNKEIALNIFNIYNVFKSLGRNGIMLNTLGEIISIGNILFNSDPKFNSIEVLTEKHDTKSEIILNFKKNKISDFIFDTMDSYYGPEREDLYHETDVHFRGHKYVPIKIEQILASKEYNDLFEIFNYQSKNTKRESIKPTKAPIEEKTEDIKYEEVEPSELIVAQIETEFENIEESEYPIRAYHKSISKKSELYSLTSLERNNNNNFLPDDIVLADGEIPNLDSFVFNIIENIIQTNYSMFIPNEHISILIDISQLSGAQNKNELCINMMVFMHLLAAFEIQFSVWMFACRNLCFCVKKPEDVFDKKRQCLIRDAYFLKRKNPDSYILSAIDTVTRLKNDKKTNLFVIFSTFISPQTLRTYDEWKKIALSCTGNKHIICLLEPYQYTCDEVDSKLKETIKDSDFIHIIRYTNICESVKEIILKLFSISKSFSKGSRLERIESITIQPHKINYEAEFSDKRYYCYKNLIDIKKISKNIDLKCLDLTTIKGDFENINMSEFKDFGEINHVASLMIPNKPTKFELSSHGYIIDIKGLINSYLSKFSNLNIFRQKTGEKIREYCADILIDCSNIVKMYSIDHCFISIISLILSLKELNIPYINLILVGKHLVPLLINQDLKFIANDDYIYSKLYCLLFEEASESRLLEEGIRQVLAHSIENSIPHILFVITDAIFGQEHEMKIKDIISFAELNGTKVIGIGTGPAPYRIDDIFTLSVYAKSPYMLREALYQLTQIAITKNKIIPNSHISSHLPIMQSENNTNEKILEQFSNVPFNNDFLLKALNQKSFDSKNFDKDYVHDETYDAGKNNEYSGYRVLVMLFYEGSPDTEDKNITKETFLHGPKDQKLFNFPSPADKLTEKGFTYSIVTTYQNAMNELLSGEYSVAILATCSEGYEGNKKNNSDYLEPFLIAMKKFYNKGGSLMLFGENPPFIFEVNLILERIGANIRFDENEKEEGGKVMYASASNNDYVKAGCFQSSDYTFNATINGNKTENLFSIGGGLKKLIEGKTLAVFKTTDGSKIEDSFRIFSRTSTGQPSCIYKVSKGREGALFIDNGASKLFNEYNEDGAARYISNLTVASIQYSQFHEYFNNDLGKETIQISMTEDEKAPKPTNLMKKKPPLLISIILDATGSMQKYIDQCKSDLEDFVDICMKKIDQLKIYFQVIAYRDFTEGNDMVEPYKITDSLTVTKNNIANIKENGGGDMCENISIGFETALKQIDEFKTIEKNFKNIFILIAGSPNHDKDFYNDDPNDLSSKKNANKPWKDIWLNINKKMKNENINKLICIDVQKDQWEYLFTKYQYKNWEKYGCKYINSIVKSKTLQVDSFDDIFVNDISNEVTLMYTSTFIGSH